jgi:hypothetical protein
MGDMKIEEGPDDWAVFDQVWTRAEILARQERTNLWLCSDEDFERLVNEARRLAFN